MNTDNVDEDIVVDTLEVEPREAKDKEFVLPGGQIIGLDQAVLQSIERCRKFHSFLIHACADLVLNANTIQLLKQPTMNYDAKCTDAYWWLAVA